MSTSIPSTPQALASDAAASPPLADAHTNLLLRLAAPDCNAALLRRIVHALAAARDAGHVCLDVKLWCHDEAAAICPETEAPRGPELEMATIRAELLRTGVVAHVAERAGRPAGAAAGDPAGAPPHAQARGVAAEAAEAIAKPLVLDAQDRLYSLRHYRAEQCIAGFVLERLQRPATPPPEQLRATLADLGMLPADADGEPDWQLAAVVAGASRALTVLCGGPGTGKTTTVAKLLSVLLHDNPKLRVAIAAPTGKAAARLGEALQERGAERPELQQPLAQLEPRTLHRLLGYLPLDDAFRFGRNRRLPYDLVIVDEVSMVDPAMFAALCQAMPDAARLVLVGDKDQLAAVAAGQVLGDLCGAAQPERGVGATFAAYLKQATDMVVASQPIASQPIASQPIASQDPGAANPAIAPARIADATVALWQNHRFGKQPGIGAFAQALMRRQPETALHSLEAGHPDLSLTSNIETALDAIQPELLQLLDAARSNDAKRALDAIPRARVLSAQRLGPTGAVQLNRRIEQRLAELGHIRADEPYYVGRPILITANDHQTRIWNGDLGVVGRSKEGQPIVWIPDAYGGVRELTPRRLPAHETAWAMTVHKAQGSEFAHVLLVLPERPGPLWNASLIYTGVTRARQRAIVCAQRDLLANGLASWPRRRSGLADALRSQ
ncbi:MAG: exodeoxyribonuclease V subunit alpha [Planctomycetota bacterium]